MSESSSLEDFEENYLDSSSGKGKAKIDIFEQSLSSSLKDFEENETEINIPEQSLPEENSNSEINSPEEIDKPKISDSFQEKILNKIENSYIRKEIKEVEEQNDGHSYFKSIRNLCSIYHKSGSYNDRNIIMIYLNKMLEKARSEKYPRMNKSNKKETLKYLDDIRINMEDDKNKVELLENMFYLSENLGNEGLTSGYLSQANTIRVGLGMGFKNLNNDNPLLFEYLVNTAKSRGYK